MKTAILALMLPSVAWAWPADSEWIALTESGLNIEDPIGDLVAGEDSLDIVGDPTTAALQWYADGTEVFFRMQLNGDPMDPSGTELLNQVWAVLIDTNGDDAFEIALASEGFDGDFSSYLMDGTPGIQPGFLSYSYTANYGDLATDQVRTALGPVSTWFIDFRISRLDLATDLGIGDLDTLRVAGVTGPSLFFDFADATRCNGLCASFSDAASDVIIIDQDLDGWTDTQEVGTGTDPLDADTDDDGLIDGLERDGDADGDTLPDAFDCDADNDGILDGTESGIITATLNPDTDLAANCFVADQDTVAPNTDPYNQDTDGGGLEDGLEDWNFDGRQDLPWETDPSDPADDLDSDGDRIADVLELLGADGSVNDIDSDGDGISDNNEWLYDNDADGVPNFLDDDSDGDGILDIVEGDDDTDGDGIPDYLDDDTDGDGIPDTVEGDDDVDGDGLGNFEDTDSDGDGIPDEVEGTGDSDGDGTPDYLDDDSDGDGIPDSVEGDDDTDGDGTPDYLDDDSDGDGIPDDIEGGDDTDGDGVPDSQDTDSDDDGKPDEIEGTDDDDCDGIPNYLDPDDEDGFCDPSQTPPNTDPNGGDNTGNGVNPLTDGGQITGGACSSAPTGVLWFPSFLAAAFAFRRRRKTVIAIAVALPSAAGAQEVNAQRFSPSVDSGGLVKLEDANFGESGTADLGAWLSYADDPLVFRPTDGDELSLLGSVATTHLTGAYHLGGFRVGAEIPIHAYTSDFNADTPVSFGDMRLSSKARFFDSDAIDAGAYLDVALPTGSQIAFVGAGELVVNFGALASLSTGALTTSMNLGVQNGTNRDLGGLSIGPAVTVGVGAHYAISNTVGAALELDREDWFGNNGERGAHPTEWLASTNVRTFERGLLTIGGGTGLSRGVGAPDFRIAAGFRLTAGKLASEENTTDPGAVVIHHTPPTPVATTGDLVVRVVGPSGKPIRNAEVRVIGSGEDPFKTGNDGILETTLPEGTHEMSIAADGWTPQKQAVVITPDNRTDVSLMLRPEEAVMVDEDSGEIYLRNKVFFELDRAELKVESAQLLDQLAETLLSHQEVTKVRVEGHTDVTGTEDHNQKLSEQRAQTVVVYLVKQGVPQSRLIAVGRGESLVLQEGDSDDVHATNRRVEFHILEE